VTRAIAAAADVARPHAALDHVAARRSARALHIARGRHRALHLVRARMISAHHPARQVRRAHDITGAARPVRRAIDHADALRIARSVRAAQLTQRDRTAAPIHRTIARRIARHRAIGIGRRIVVAAAAIARRDAVPVAAADLAARALLRRLTRDAAIPDRRVVAADDVGEDRTCKGQPDHEPCRPCTGDAIACDGFPRHRRAGPSGCATPSVPCQGPIRNATSAASQSSV
jgi:hypothetical protein